MSSISTHVLDTSRGRPAQGVPVILEHWAGKRGWTRKGRGRTDRDGRVGTLVAGPRGLARGRYRLTFGVGKYFRARRLPAFYSQVTIDFIIRNAGEHHHVPLLLSPFGYSTYRGS